MKKIIKYLVVIMALIMILGACTQENTDNNNSNNAQTGVVGKWKTAGGIVYDFASNGDISTSGNYYVSGSWYGNDIEGEIGLKTSSGNWDDFYYTIQGNNMTITNTDSGVKEYLTRM